MDLAPLTEKSCVQVLPKGVAVISWVDKALLGVLSFTCHNMGHCDVV